MGLRLNRHLALVMELRHIQLPVVPVMGLRLDRHLALVMELRHIQLLVQIMELNQNQILVLVMGLRLQVLVMGIRLNLFLVPTVGFVLTQLVQVQEQVRGQVERHTPPTLELKASLLAL